MFFKTGIHIQPPQRMQKKTPTKTFSSQQLSIVRVSLGGGNVSTDSPNGRRGNKKQREKKNRRVSQDGPSTIVYKWSDMGKPL